MKEMIWHEVTTEETIPDDTVIIACINKKGEWDIYMDAYYDRREKRWYFLEELGFDYWAPLGCRPTHWMPQPDPPQVTE